MDLGTSIRLVQETDAADLALLLQRSREHLEPWEPDRPANYASAAGQREDIARALAEQTERGSWPGVICHDRVVVGRITLFHVLRGPIQSCLLGYWVGADHVRRGIAAEAARLALDIAFGELGLHRVQASAQTTNTPSQRVLERNGFRRVGVLPNYIYIAGQWRDSVLFERLAPDSN